MAFGIGGTFIFFGKLAYFAIGSVVVSRNQATIAPMAATTTPSKTSGTLVSTKRLKAGEDRKAMIKAMPDVNNVPENQSVLDLLRGFPAVFSVTITPYEILL